MADIPSDHQWELLAKVGAAVTALWAFTKWLLEPRVIAGVKMVLQEELKELKQATTALTAISVQQQDHERRIERLEDKA